MLTLERDSALSEAFAGWKISVERSIKIQSMELAREELGRARLQARLACLARDCQSVGS